MKKFLLLITVLFAASNVFATSLVKISKMDGPISIKTPNGELKEYKTIDKVPEITYGSKIYAGNTQITISIFKTADIILEKKQGIMIAKDPIKRNIEVMKLETESKNPEIKVILAGNIHGTFSSDCKVFFYENFPNIKFGVKAGYAMVKGYNATYKLEPGEYYEAKLNLLEY